jgi:hypothetical protein
VDQEERHADQNQGKRLCQGILSTRDGLVHDRTEQADQSPQHDFNADECDQIKI